jgi:hypothetical protein
MNKLVRFQSKQQSIQPALDEQQQPVKPQQAQQGGKCYATLGCIWIEALKDATHRETFKIAIYLMQEYFSEGRTNITLSNVALREWRIRKDCKMAAIAELERLGLILVERNGDRRSPIVHLLHTEELPKPRRFRW